MIYGPYTSPLTVFGFSSVLGRAMNSITKGGPGGLCPMEWRPAYGHRQDGIGQKQPSVDWGIGRRMLP